MFSDRIDHFAYLLGRALLIGIDRPQIQLFQAVITREVRECAFAGDQPAFISRELRQFCMQWRQSLLDFRFIILRIFLVGCGMVGIVFHQRIANVVHVDKRVLR